MEKSNKFATTRAAKDVARIVVVMKTILQTAFEEYFAFLRWGSQSVVDPTRGGGLCTNAIVKLGAKLVLLFAVEFKG